MSISNATSLIDIYQPSLCAIVKAKSEVDERKREVPAGDALFFAFVDKK